MILKNLPKWRNLDKSGHTDWHSYGIEGQRREKEAKRLTVGQTNFSAIWIRQ